MNRRSFFRNIAGIFVASQAPGIFVPKLITPVWKVPKILRANYSWWEAGRPLEIWWDEYHLPPTDDAMQNPINDYSFMKEFCKLRGIPYTPDIRWKTQPI